METQVHKKYLTATDPVLKSTPASLSHQLGTGKRNQENKIVNQWCERKKNV